MSSAPSPPPTSYADSPCTYSRSLDLDTDALVASTLRVLDQRAAPSMHEILAAYTAKGDGDRDMLFALLNAKSAEDSRMAADRNLRRTLLEVCRTTATPSPSAYGAHHQIHGGQPYPLPSPPTSLYQQSPAILPHSPPRRRTSSSSSRSSQEDTRSPHLRKRRRSRSPSRQDYREYRSRASYEPHPSTQSDAPFPPSPYSSHSSSQHTGSPRSREAMTIGSLLSTRSAEYQESERRATSPAS